MFDGERDISCSLVLRLSVYLSSLMESTLSALCVLQRWQCLRRSQIKLSRVGPPYRGHFPLHVSVRSAFDSIM